MMESKNANKITVRSLVLGTLFAGLFAIMTVYFENATRLYTTANQVPLLPYILLVLAVLLVNPLCRLIRIVRPFALSEILIVFIMGSVSSGLSTFGMASQLIPISGNLFNEHWNTDQSEWDQYVVPFLNESYFVSEPGTQEAAIAYRGAVMQLKDAQDLYQAALAYEKSVAALRRAEKALDGARSADGSAARKDMAISRATQAVSVARQIREQTKAEWQETRARSGAADLREVLTSLPSTIKAHQGEMHARKAALQKLQQRAFAKVRQYRRGLPKDQRSMPGVLPTLSEGLEVYFARISRLRHGRRALKHLARARETLDRVDADSPISAEVGGQWSALIDQAIDELAPIGESKAVLERRDALVLRWERTNQEFLTASTKLEELREKRRGAATSEFAAIDDRIDDLDDRVEDLTEDKQQIELRRDRLDLQITMAARVTATAETLTQFKTALKDGSATAGALRSRLDAIAEQFPAFDASLKKFLVGGVPWEHWIGPLLNWGLLIGVTYVILMAFNLLLFRHWAYNEKLIYPLVELPETLAGARHSDGRTVPAVFRTGFFWVGFTVSAAVLGWNLLCRSQVIPDLTEIDLSNSWSDYIQNSAVEGLRPSAKSAIFFTLVGLAFLIPAQVSFSLWFFWILFMVQVLILVWMGYGVNQNSFPTEWWYTLNFRTAEGGGALMVFASVVLYKCRTYILCFFLPSAVADLERAERIELRISSFLFVFGSAGLILLLWKGMGANLLYTILSYVVILFITVGLVRAVTEGGVLGFQAWVSPFHFIRTVFGMNKAWTSMKLFAPLVSYYCILFLDIKTFIAPAMANSIKMRDNLKMKRIRFHLGILFCLLAAGTCAVAAQLIMSYDRGGDGMESWFHSAFPRRAFDHIASTIKTAPEDTTNNLYWVLFGAGVMAALLYGRRFIFWLPHPIGMIMLVNPIMSTFWFSIFLGWLAKTLVTRYGNKDTYGKLRCMFIGLIFGELVIVVAAMIVSAYLQKPMSIDLNRN